MDASNIAAPPAPPQAGVRWARVFAALVLALLCVELVARVYVRVWSGQSFQSMSFYDWSPYGLVRNNPRLTSPAFHINENGFRSYRTYARKKPPRTLRVLMLGGSVLYSGLGRTFLQNEGRVTSDATMAQWLERRLQADSALSGINVEVINGAVNFNRIVEASAGYLAEYVFWQPDVVIVCGSANNFRAYWPKADEIDANNVVQSVHPWRAEFDRLANGHGAQSWTENTLRALEEHLASVAIGRRALAMMIDRVAFLPQRFNVANRANRATPLHRATSAAVAPRANGATFPLLADSAEVEHTLHDYLGYADAIVAAAREHDQDVAFFWEYFIGHMDGIKPFSADERYLFGVERATRPEDVRYNFMMRDRVRTHLDSLRVPLIDPLPELKRYVGTVWIDYLHYTKNGNHFMADVMYDRLQPLIHTRAARIRAGEGTLAR